MAISFNPALILQNLEAGNSEAVAVEILNLLRHFETEKVEEFSAEFQGAVNLMSKVILHVISSEKFIIPINLAPEFIRLNTTLANLVHLSDSGNADLFLKKIRGQQGADIKLLALYSPYCTTRLDVAKFFAASRYLASLWVAAILKGRWKGTEQTYKFISDLMQNPALGQFLLSDANFPLTEETSFAYFDATYASSEHDRKFRDIINAEVQKNFQFSYNNTSPDFKRILIVSAFFYKGHAVYRCLAPLIKALKPDYHVALFYLGIEHHDKLDSELFDEIHTTGATDTSGSFTQEMLEEILGKNYGVCIITDVGLSRPSLILANLRLAPIQITTYGHPVTSGKTKIDYYIAGSEVEPKENPQRNYEEKLLVIPGLAVEPVMPDYKPAFPKLSDEQIEIGLSWGEMKYTYPHLLRLKEIQKKSPQKLHFNFIGISPTRLTYLAAKKDLDELFGAENISVTPSLANHDYMRTVEVCHLFLDSHHFGSYNRVVDCLLCRKPLITIDGEKSYQRFAAALLRQCGLNELIAKTPDDFTRLALEYISNKNFQKDIAEKLARLDIQKLLFETGNEKYFKDGVDTIIKNHRSNITNDNRQLVITSG